LSADPFELMRAWPARRRVPGGARILEEYSVAGAFRVRVIDAGVERLYDIVLPEPTPRELKALERIYLEFLSPRSRSFRELLAREKRLRDVVREWARLEVEEFGVLSIILSDPYVEDVQVRAPDHPLRVIHSRYQYLLTTFTLPESYIERLAKALEKAGGVTITLRRPFASFQVKGVRVSITKKSDVSPYTTITIRKPLAPWNLGLFVKMGVLPVEAAAVLWLSLKSKIPMLVIGEMGSGKTSMISAILSTIPREYSVVLIEDQPEIQVPWPAIRMLTRDSPDKETRVTAFDLLVQALRESADIVIVGEVRGEEAAAWGQAILLGHGGLTSFHGESPERALTRLMLPPLNVAPVCVDAIGAVIHMQRSRVNGRIVRVASIYSVEGVEVRGGRAEPRVKPYIVWDNISKKHKMEHRVEETRLGRMLATRLGIPVSRLKSMVEAHAEALLKAAEKTYLGEPPQEFNKRLYKLLQLLK